MGLLGKQSLSSGEARKVGRGEAAELRVPGDSELAEAHLELGWDGRAAQVRNLVKDRPLLHGGRSADASELFDGSWLRAGRTDFMVYFERTEGLVPSNGSTQSAGALLELTLQKESVFGLFDAAHAPWIVDALHHSVDEYQSLYAGPRGEALADCAPYLVRFRNDSWLLSSLARAACGGHGGVFLTSKAELASLRRHFRRFLSVWDPNGERVYFRFYDPRVLHPFLQSAGDKMAQELLGPLSAVWFAHPDSGEPVEVRACRIERGGHRC
jgi:hypothetical protein